VKEREKKEKEIRVSRDLNCSTSGDTLLKGKAGDLKVIVGKRKKGEGGREREGKRISERKLTYHGDHPW